MLAVQAQNAAAARWALGVRTRGAALSDVEARLLDGSLIRTWPMRGTHHLMAADDVSWLTRLCAPRARSGIEQRREALGLTLADVMRAGEVIVAQTREPGQLPDEVAATAVTLPPGTGRAEGAVALTRDGVRGVLAVVGIDADGNRGAHMLRFLCEERVLVQGPPVGGKETFTAFEAWVPGGSAARETGPEGEEAVRELVVRHVTARGPVTEADIAWWSGLPMGAVRRGVADADDLLVRVEVSGVDCVMATKAAAGGARPPRNARLLPAFDEYLMGYRDRSLVLTPEHADAVGPTKNGLVAAMVLAGGNIVGTWTSTKRASGPSVKVDDWVGGPPGLDKAIDEYRRFATT